MRVWDGAPAAKLTAKFLVTALLLFVAFRTVDVVSVSKLLSRLSAAWTAAAFALTALIIVSDATLMARVMRTFERRMRFGTAFRYSLVGWFFSNVAPSTVGGDVFRGLQLARAGMSPSSAARLVVAVRILSFSTLVLVMLMGFPIAVRLLSAPRDVFLLGSIILAATGAICALFVFAHFTARIPKLKQWIFGQRLEAIARDVQKLLVPSFPIAGAWLAAFVQHLLRVGTLICLAAGLGLGIPFAVLFAFTPAALLLAMLPISLGGWGLRELTFVYLLGAAGIGAEAALSLSIAFGLLRMIIGTIGGITWVMLSDHHFRLDTSA